MDQEGGESMSSCKPTTLYLSGPILYLSGPISGKEDSAADRFSSAARILEGAGYRVVNPMDIADTAMSWQAAMRMDIKAMCECVGVALMEGWEESQGCRFEREVAQQLDMPVAPIASWLYRRETSQC